MLPPRPWRSSQVDLQSAVLAGDGVKAVRDGDANARAILGALGVAISVDGARLCHRRRPHPPHFTGWAGYDGPGGGPWLHRRAGYRGPLQYAGVWPSMRGHAVYRGPGKQRDPAHLHRRTRLDPGRRRRRRLPRRPTRMAPVATDRLASPSMPPAASSLLTPTTIASVPSEGTGRHRTSPVPQVLA